MTLLDKALELGKTISVSDEYNLVKQVEENLRNDEVARKLIVDFQDLQKYYDRMEMAGQRITEENMKKLDEMEQKAMENVTVRSYYEANSRFHELVETVNAKIQEGISGRPAHSCGGG